MKPIQTLAAALMSGALAAPLPAADFSDPAWPCLQRKVENLSIGLMWPHPVAETAPPAETEAAARELAESLALRRVDLDAAGELVAGFAGAHGRTEALMGHVFEQVFHQLAGRRSTLMDGIADFSLKQIALSEKIDAARVEMDTLMAAGTPDYDRIDKLEEQIDWDERIFTDRQRSLTYVCETPVLLEKRLFAVAQLLLAAAEE